jgi:hypothetical protein
MIVLLLDFVAFKDHSAHVLYLVKCKTQAVESV